MRAAALEWYFDHSDGLFGPRSLTELSDALANSPCRLTSCPNVCRETSLLHSLLRCLMSEGRQGASPSYTCCPSRHRRGPWPEGVRTERVFLRRFGPRFKPACNQLSESERSRLPSLSHEYRTSLIRIKRSHDAVFEALAAVSKIRNMRRSLGAIMAHYNLGKPSGASSSRFTQYFVFQHRSARQHQCPALFRRYKSTLYKASHD